MAIEEKTRKERALQKIPSKTFVSDQSLKNECLYSLTAGKIYSIIVAKKMELGRNTYYAFQSIQSI